MTPRRAPHHGPSGQASTVTVGEYCRGIDVTMLDNSTFMIRSCNSPWQARIGAEAGPCCRGNGSALERRCVRVVRAPSPVGAVSGARYGWRGARGRRARRNGRRSARGGRTGRRCAGRRRQPPRRTPDDRHNHGETPGPPSGAARARRPGRPAGWRRWLRSPGRALEHLSNPWFTRAIVAPAGVQLGYHALMPLEGAAMMPVTVLFGPSASDNLLSILMPGLMCYAMYRAARLWLRTQTGAVITGAFFGLSSIMAWHAWYQLNLAAGAVFLPLGAFDPEAQVLATADGHPRAVGYLSRLPEPTLMAVRRNPFYAGLLSAQGQPRGLVESVTGYHSYTALLAAARAEARRMDVGWVIVWQRSPDVLAYMAKTGFRLAC